MLSSETKKWKLRQLLHELVNGQNMGSLPVDEFIALLQEICEKKQ